MTRQFKWAIGLLALSTLLVACDGDRLMQEITKPTHINQIKPDSPLYSVFEKTTNDPRDMERMTQSLLEKLPVGSTKPEIDAFIAKHLLAVEPKVTYPNFWNKQNAFI